MNEETFTQAVIYGRLLERDRIVKLLQRKMDGRDSWLDAIEWIKSPDFSHLPSEIEDAQFRKWLREENNGYLG